LAGALDGVVVFDDVAGVVVDAAGDVGTFFLAFAVMADVGARVTPCSVTISETVSLSEPRGVIVAGGTMVMLRLVGAGAGVVLVEGVIAAAVASVGAGAGVGVALPLVSPPPCCCRTSEKLCDGSSVDDGAAGVLAAPAAANGRTEAVEDPEEESILVRGS
jgi:hypothetical protein